MEISPLKYRYNWKIHYKNEEVFNQVENDKINLFRDINQSEIDYVEIIDKKTTHIFSFKLPPNSDLIIFEMHEVKFNTSGTREMLTTQHYGYKKIIEGQSREFLLRFQEDNISFVER